MPALSRNLGLGVILSMKNRLSGPAMAGAASMNFLEKNIDAATAAQLRFAAATQVGGALIVGAGAAAIALGLLTAAAASFETGMTRVAAIIKPTRQELGGLTDAAIQAGIATQFSPRQATEGLKDLATAGFNARESITALNPVLDLATGSLGQLGVAEAAATAAAAVRGFGFEAKDTAKVVDILLRSTQLTNIQARDLRVMLSRAGGAARAAGQEFEETVAILGSLRNIGVEASVAGTTFRSALRAMTQTKAKQELASLNIALADSQGNFRNVSDIVFDMNKRFETLTEVQRKAAIEAVFGTRGQNLFNAVVSLGSDKMGTLTERLKNASGTAADFRKRVLEPLSGRIVLMAGSIATLATSLGKPLLAPIKILVSIFTNFLNVLIRLTQTFPIITAIAVGTVALGAILAALVGTVLLLAGAIGFAQKKMLLSIIIEKARLSIEILIAAKMKARIILERIVAFWIAKRTSITFASVSAATAEKVAALGTNAALIIQNILRRISNLLTLKGIKGMFLSAKAAVVASGATTAAAGATGLFAGAIRGLTIAMLANPILLIISAIILFVVVLVKLARAFWDAKGASQALFAVLLILLSPIGAIIVLAKIFSSAWKKNLAGVSSAFAQMKKAIMSIFEPLSTMFTMSEEGGESIGGLFKSIMTLVMKPFALAFAVIARAATVAGAIMQIFVQEFRAAFAPLQPVIEELSKSFDILTTSVFGRGKSNLTFWKSFGKIVRGITRVVLVPLAKVIGIIIKGVILMSRVVNAAVNAFTKLGQAAKTGKAFGAGLKLGFGPGIISGGLGLLGLQHGGVTDRPTTAKLSERGQTEVAMPLPTGMRATDLRDILQSFKRGRAEIGAAGPSPIIEKVVIENRIFLDSREIHRSQREINELDELRSFGLAFGET